MVLPDVLVSARGPLPAGPLRVVCHRRWHAVVSLRRGMGQDERPDLHVEWGPVSLVERQHGRLGLLEARYDPDTHRAFEPRYETLSVPEALALSPLVGELMAAEEARWARSEIRPNLGDLVRIAVLPGPAALDSLLRQLAPEAGHRMPSEVGASPEDARPELLLSLMAIHRRHPEIVLAERERVSAKVLLALSRMTAEQRSRHAAEAAHARWSLLEDPEGALDLLAGWAPPVEWLQANHHGVEALALPPELVFAHLARADLATDTARAFFKHHLLDPVANELNLGDAVPLPGPFFAERPVIDERWLELARTSPEKALLAALVGQFGGWSRVGGSIAAASAGAGVDRMPTMGPRPPDPRGVRAALHVVNDSPNGARLEVGEPTVRWGGGPAKSGGVRASVPSEVPSMSAMTVDLGALDDQRLEPGARFEVVLPVRIGDAAHRFTLEGAVATSW